MVYSNEERDEHRRTGRRPGLESVLPEPSVGRPGPRDPRRVLRGLSMVMAVISLLGLALGAVSVRWEALALAVLGLALALLYWLVSRMERPGPALIAVTIGLAIGRALVMLTIDAAAYGATLQTLLVGVVFPLWVLVIAIRAMLQIQRTAVSAQ
jgi:hypothetical protein